MYIIAKYQHKLERAGTFARETLYKRPVFIRKDPNREPRKLNPNTPRSVYAVTRTRYTIYHHI